MLPTDTPTENSNNNLNKPYYSLKLKIMKKAFIIVAILLATATTITIVSCKKEKENVKSNNTENSFMHHELSDMDKAMIAFGEKIKTAAEKKDAVTMLSLHIRQL